MNINFRNRRNPCAGEKVCSIREKKALALAGVVREELPPVCVSPVAFNAVADDIVFQSLKGFLKRVPSIEGEIGAGFFHNGCWWMKFTINIEHLLAWNTVQELGHVLITFR